MEGLIVIEESIVALPLYAQIPIEFTASTRASLEGLLMSSGANIQELAIEPFRKNYDDCEEDRPTSLPKRFDVSNWIVLSAFLGEVRVGGAILARSTASLDMREGRDDLCLIMDIRIHPDFRGRHIGEVVIQGAIDWARKHRCIEIKVETQDINVPACRFYFAQGFRLTEVNQGVYEGLDETQLIWRGPI